MNELSILMYIEITKKYMRGKKCNELIQEHRLEHQSAQRVQKIRDSTGVIFSAN